MLMPKSNYSEMQKPLLPALTQTLHGVGVGSRKTLTQVSEALRQQTSSCVPHQPLLAQLTFVPLLITNLLRVYHKPDTGLDMAFHRH